MQYLTNVWYVAATTLELGLKPFHRTILGTEIVLYRKSDGETAALRDRCAHRFAPLHLGEIKGDALQCPYHGLQFGPDGQCVHNPQGAGKITRGARVQSYPVAERHGFVWIWMGAVESAEYSLIPDLSQWEDKPDHIPVRGYIRPKANYELLTDNLMDLSHALYLHSGGIGSAAIERAKSEVVVAGRSVTSNLWMPDELPSPYYSARFNNYQQPVDHWLDMTWRPAAILTLDSGITPTGRPREEGVRGLVAHLLTPETETTTHYFWIHTRSDRRQDLDVSAQIAKALRTAFEREDQPMIEAQQAMMGTSDLWSLRPIFLPADAAAVRVRRTLAELIKEENADVGPALLSEVAGESEQRG